MNNKKTVNSFDQKIIRKFNRVEDFKVKKLFSSDNDLPNIICVNSKKHILIAIESESTFKDFAFIPYRHVNRCFDWLHMFGLYHDERIILACEFKKTDNRKLKYYYKILPYQSFPEKIKINYNGTMMIYENSTWEKITAEDFKF